jgi:hypothetical protein
MEGGLLDLWVALAIGMRRSVTSPKPNEYGHYWMRMGIGASVFACPRFSFSHRDAMFVIEHFKPSLTYGDISKLWVASAKTRTGFEWVGVGETPAIAACRAVVLAHFGQDPQLDTDDEPTDYDPELNGPRAYSAAY